MNLTNYTRRPFDVDAIQVTADNLEEVASLCGGNTSDIPYGRDRIIRVPVKNPQTRRHSEARVGDWVVYHQGGWKVYNDRAFKSSFQQTTAVANDLASFAKRENGHVFDSSADSTDILGEGLNKPGWRR